MVHMLWPNVHANSLGSIICDIIYVVTSAPHHNDNGCVVSVDFH